MFVVLPLDATTVQPAVRPDREPIGMWICWLLTEFAGFVHWTACSLNRSSTLPLFCLTMSTPWCDTCILFGLRSCFDDAAAAGYFCSCDHSSADSNIEQYALFHSLSFNLILFLTHTHTHTHSHTFFYSLRLFCRPAARRTSSWTLQYSTLGWIFCS